MIAGMACHSIVLMHSYHKGFRATPDRFFINADPRWCLKQLTMVISSRCVRTGLSAKVQLSGTELEKWIPVDFPLDLATKFRRAKFAAYLLLHLCVTYREGVSGEYEISILNMPRH
jgi:hypothetical protein